MSKKVKDKQKFLFNPLTGNFDLVLQFNPDQIVTVDYNAAGSQFMTYDAFSGEFVPSIDQVVVDENGNVVVANEQDNVTVYQEGDMVEI